MKKIPKMKFKTKKIAEYFTSPKLSDNLLSIIYIVQAYCWLQYKKNITITELYRTQKEQDYIYRKVKGYNKKSVHQFWRGCDIRTRGVFNKKQALEIEAFLNMIYYDSRHNTSKYHDVGMGKHLHLQSKRW